MKYLQLRAERQRPLAWYLAMEEWAARHYEELGGDELWFMWRVQPTVIFGRNQRIEQEVDLEYCRREGIDVCRRKSGGGAVYADMENVMVSFITDDSAGRGVVPLFRSYTSRLAAMLQQLGLPAEASERNDVSIEGRKVSGNAFYRRGTRCIMHGTMLWGGDARGHMSRALTPSRGKLAAKGVASVVSRVTTVREHLPELPLPAFMQHMRQSLCGNDEYVLTEADEREVDALAEMYFRDAWLWGRPVSGAVRHTLRREGVGEFTCDVSTDTAGRITEAWLHGDFFTVGDIEELMSRLHGVEARPEALRRALAEVNPADYVAGLTTDDLVTLLAGEQ